MTASAVVAGDENGGVARRRRCTVVRVKPVRVYGAGFSGWRIVAASTWVCFLAEGPAGGAAANLSRLALRRKGAWLSWK